MRTSSLERAQSQLKVARTRLTRRPRNSLRNPSTSQRRQLQRRPKTVILCSPQERWSQASQPLSLKRRKSPPVQLRMSQLKKRAPLLLPASLYWASQLRRSKSWLLPQAQLMMSSQRLLHQSPQLRSLSHLQNQKKPRPTLNPSPRSNPPPKMWFLRKSPRMVTLLQKLPRKNSHQSRRTHRMPQRSRQTDPQIPRGNRDKVETMIKFRRRN